MFVGRQDLLDRLLSLWNKATPSSLVTCRGRRRIGKSRLIEEFAIRSQTRFVKIEGLSPREAQCDADQLKAFHVQLQVISGKTYKATNWLQAFKDLDEALTDEPTVLLLDEISWLGGFNKDFPGYLKIAWDNFFHKRDRLIVVLCGSVSSWIQKNIMNNTAFLGRRSLDLVVDELPPRLCRAFWGASADKVSSRELLDMLSVTGGVPRYLEEIKSALTLDENIRRMCFTSDGYLFEDFDLMFSEIYGDSALERKQVLEVLAAAPLSVSGIAERLGKTRNGHLSATVRELVMAGFVREEHGFNPMTGRPAQETTYRICDNYVRFYFRAIRPRAQMIAAGSYRFESLDQLPGWESILGLQFENLVLNALPELVRRLGLDRSLILSAAPFRKGGANGCQIDCLIQTKRSLYVIEIKRRAEIGGEVIGEVEEKIARLKCDRRLSVRPILVYDGRLSPSVREENYFAMIISAEELFL